MWIGPRPTRIRLIQSTVRLPILSILQKRTIPSKLTKLSCWCTLLRKNTQIPLLSAQSKILLPTPIQPQEDQRGHDWSQLKDLEKTLLATAIAATSNLLHIVISLSPIDQCFPLSLLLSELSMTNSLSNSTFALLTSYFLSKGILNLLTILSILLHTPLAHLLLTQTTNYYLFLILLLLPLKVLLTNLSGSEKTILVVLPRILHYLTPKAILSPLTTISPHQLLVAKSPYILPSSALLFFALLPSLFSLLPSKSLPSILLPISLLSTPFHLGHSLLIILIFFFLF